MHYLRKNNSKIISNATVALYFIAEKTDSGKYVGFFFLFDSIPRHYSIHMYDTSFSKGLNLAGDSTCPRLKICIVDVRRGFLIVLLHGHFRLQLILIWIRFLNHDWLLLCKLWKGANCE